METQTNAAMALGIGMLMPFIIIGSLVSVLLIVAQWFIYSKAKQPGWAVLIPIYNMIVLLKIVGKPVSWILWFFQVIVFCILYAIAPGAITGILLFLSYVACIVFAVIVTNGLSKSFGKDAGFTVGLIFLGFVFYPILGFGKATYIGPGGVPPTGDNTPAQA